MKKQYCWLFPFLFLCFSATSLRAQFGVSYHTSPLSFIGVNYEAGNKLLTELRISTNQYLSDLGLEAIAALKIGRRAEADPYIGIGFRYDPEGLGVGLVVPLGMNVYPFPKRNIGFHLEIAPIAGDDIVIRGSWGIRYRFGNKDN